jgi:hypothetical protein
MEKYLEDLKASRVIMGQIAADPCDFMRIRDCFVYFFSVGGLQVLLAGGKMADELRARENRNCLITFPSCLIENVITSLVKQVFEAKNVITSLVKQVFEAKNVITSLVKIVFEVKNVITSLVKQIFRTKDVITSLARQIFSIKTVITIWIK